jgi:hypothetical protein
MSDLSFANLGSLWLLRAESENGQDWIAENLPDNAIQWSGAIVVEPRYVHAIADGAQSDGLRVSVS